MTLDLKKWWGLIPIAVGTILILADPPVTRGSIPEKSIQDRFKELHELTEKQDSLNIDLMHAINDETDPRWIPVHMIDNANAIILNLSRSAAGGYEPDLDYVGEKVESLQKKLFTLRQKRGGRSSTAINWATEDVYKGGRLVMMAPLEYLSKTPSPCGTGHTADQDIDMEGCFSKSSLDYITNQVMKGEKIEVPYLDYEHPFRGYPTHEGRHRALVAYRLGVKSMPVIILGKG